MSLPCILLTERCTGMAQILGEGLFTWTQCHYHTAHTSINTPLAAQHQQWDSCQLELLTESHVHAVHVHGAL